MASADYRLCDVCGGKTFYDATLGYTDSATVHPRRVGRASYSQKLDWLGDWAVLCMDCAQRWRTAIVLRTEEDGT